MHLSISAFLASNSARVINPSSYIFFKASILDTPLTFSPASASTSGTDWAQPIFSYSVDTSLFMRVAFTPQLILTSATSGTFRDFWKKNDDDDYNLVSISLLTSGAEGDFR